MVKIKKNVDSNETPDTVDTAIPVAVWIELSKRTFNWGDESKIIGDQTVNALHYLIDMGAKQAYGDTSAARASFIGVKTDGTPAKDAWLKNDREKVAKEYWVVVNSGTSDDYNDSDMGNRNTLADAYFAAKTAAKWKRIENGSLTVGGRGVRLSPDEQWLYDAAETDYLNRLAKQSAKIADKIAAVKKSDPEMADESDANVRRFIVNKFLTANRTKFDKMLTDFKAANDATDSIDIDI